MTPDEATADSIINECCGQCMSLDDYKLLESRIVSALENAREQGKREAFESRLRLNQNAEPNH